MWFAVTGWDITEWTVAAAAFVTAFGVIWTKVVRPVIRWGQRIEKATTWTETQMKPNGGSSAWDMILKLKEQSEVTQQQVKLLLRHDAERDRAGMRYGDGETPDNPNTQRGTT